MFSMINSHKDTVVPNAFVVPIKSYESYTKTVAHLKLGETYLVTHEGLVCYIKPFKMEVEDECIWLDISITDNLGNTKSLVTVIVSDENLDESLIILEDESYTLETILPSIINSINSFLQPLT